MQGRQGREGCDKSKLANNAVARARAVITGKKSSPVLLSGAAKVPVA